MENFSLTLEQTKVMYSLEYHLVLDDIDNESNPKKKSLKREWLLNWRNSIESLHKNQNPNSFCLITFFPDLKKEIDKLNSEPGSSFDKKNILLEISLFNPYQKLGINNDNKFKDLKIADREKTTKKLENFASKLGLSTDCVKRFTENYQKAINGISGRFVKTLMGGFIGTAILAVAAAFFTPAIAIFLAPILAPGLSGAAAVSAVLAFLGGGAIAVGGFGMAGGFAVLVAGGAILGGSAGATVGTLFAQSPDIALTQAAKLEVVMKEIIFIQKDIRLAQEIIKEQRQAIRSLEDKIDELVLNKEKNKKDIENLKKAIEYLKKALERNQALL